MNILLLGDIIGPSGRKAIIEKLPKLIKKQEIDFVIVNGNRLSMYSICDQRWIDVKKYFDLTKDREMRAKVKEERNILIQRILSSDDQLSRNKNRKSDFNFLNSEPFSCTEGALE